MAGFVYGSIQLGLGPWQAFKTFRPLLKEHPFKHPSTRFSSREVGIRVPFFLLSIFVGEPSPKKVGKRALLGDLAKETVPKLSPEPQDKRQLLLLAGRQEQRTATSGEGCEHEDAPEANVLHRISVEALGGGGQGGGGGL